VLHRRREDERAGTARKAEERDDDARRVYYDRTDSPLWNIIQSAADVPDHG
jgi:hypothetical protein